MEQSIKLKLDEEIKKRLKKMKILKIFKISKIL
jgi:hypothetical protein